MDRTEIIEPPDTVKLPIAPVVFVEGQFGVNYWKVINCPFCGRSHIHGAGETGQNPADHLGLRISHCPAGPGQRLPDVHGVYELRPVSLPDEESLEI